MTALRLQIRELRRARGLSQGELAERAGVGRVTVNRIESGRQRRVDLDVLEKLAAVLGVAPGLLIAEDGATGARRPEPAAPVRAGSGPRRRRKGIARGD